MERSILDVILNDNAVRYIFDLLIAFLRYKNHSLREFLLKIITH